MSGLQNHNGRTDDRMDKKKPLKLYKNKSDGGKRHVQVEPISEELRQEIAADIERAERRKLRIFTIGMVLVFVIVISVVWFGFF